MKGLDTNILVRYLTGDDPAQTNRAIRFVERECTPERPCFLNNIVFCELVWVLARGQRIERARLHRMIETLLSSLEFAFEDKDLLWQALEAFAEGGDFADAVIAGVNKKNGCSSTATFDRGAETLAGFESV